MQIFAERIEFCWTHLRGIGALENSLWAYDGRGMRVWLNALSLEAQPSDHAVKESVNIPLEFYPLCEPCSDATMPHMLMDRVSCAHGQGNYYRS